LEKNTPPVDQDFHAQKRQRNHNTFNCLAQNSNCLNLCLVQLHLHLPYSTPSPFVGITLLKNPAKNRTMMQEVKTLWEKMGIGETKTQT
jgi:hypothetical protein